MWLFVDHDTELHAPLNLLDWCLNHPPLDETIQRRVDTYVPSRPEAADITEADDNCTLRIEDDWKPIAPDGPLGLEPAGAPAPVEPPTPTWMIRVGRMAEDNDVVLKQQTSSRYSCRLLIKLDEERTRVMHVFVQSGGFNAHNVLQLYGLNPSNEDKLTFKQYMQLLIRPLDGFTTNPTELRRRTVEKAWVSGRGAVYRFAEVGDGIPCKTPDAAASGPWGAELKDGWEVWQGQVRLRVDRRECPFCLDELSTAPVATGKCTVCYFEAHRHCLDPWRDNGAATCVTCRADLPHTLAV